MNLQPIVSWTTSNLPLAIPSAALIVEIILRLIPSQKPQSLALMVSNLFHSLATIFTNVANFIDKVIPQNIK